MPLEFLQVASLWCLSEKLSQPLFQTVKLSCWLSQRSLPFLGQFEEIWSAKWLPCRLHSIAEVAKALLQPHSLANRVLSGTPTTLATEMPENIVEMALPAFWLPACEPPLNWPCSRRREARAQRSFALLPVPRSLVRPRRSNCPALRQSR